MVLSHTVDEGKTTVSGQTHLRQDQIGLEQRTCVKGRDQIPCRVNFHRSFGQDVAKPRALTRRGLDDQHAAREIRRLKTGSEPHSGFSPTSGRKVITSDYTEDTPSTAALFPERNIMLSAGTSGFFGQHGG